MSSDKINYDSITDSSETLTIQDAIETVGFGRFQIQFFFVIVLVYIAEAMEIMLISILSPALHCEWAISELQQAFLTTIVFLGMACSCSLWGHFSDKYGRKPSLISACTFMLICALLSSLAPSYIWLLIFRGMAGLGLGSLTLAAATYCEYLPVKYRAKGLLLLTVCWGVGSCLEVVIGWLVMQRWGWRAFVALSASPLLVFLAIAPMCMEESVRFLLVSGKTKECLRVLEKIANRNGSKMPEGTLVDETSENRGSIRDVFSAQHFKTTAIVSLLWLTTVFVYYGFVLFATQLYNSNDPCKGGHDPLSSTNKSLCGLTNRDYFSLLWTSSSEILGGFLSLILVDVVGRKKTMAFELLAAAASLACLLACLNNISMTVFISLSRGFVQAAAGTINAYAPEVYPTKIRAVGVGTCSAIARIGALLSPYVAQVVSAISLDIPIIIYTILCCFASLLAMLLPVETMGIDSG